MLPLCYAAPYREHVLKTLDFVSGYASRNTLNRNGTEGTDSVMDLKRELRQKQVIDDDETPTTSSTSSEQSSSSRGSSEQGESIDRQEDVNHDYQTMDRWVRSPGHLAVDDNHKYLLLNFEVIFWQHA